MVNIKRLLLGGLVGAGVSLLWYGLIREEPKAVNLQKPKVSDSSQKKTAKQGLEVTTEMQSGLVGRVGLDYDVRCFDASGKELEFKRNLNGGNFSYDPVEVRPNETYTCRALNSDERLVEVTEGDSKHLVAMELIADKPYPVRGFNYNKERGSVSFGVDEKDNGVYRLTLPVGRIESDKVVHRATRTLDFVVRRTKKGGFSGGDLAVDREYPGFGLRNVYGHR